MVDETCQRSKREMIVIREKIIKVGLRRIFSLVGARNFMALLIPKAEKMARETVVAMIRYWAVQG